VTLKFLGEVSETTDGAELDLETTVAAIERSVGDAAVEPFDVVVDDVGAFPSPEYISVIWLGVDDGADSLTALHESIEAETVAAGFSPEDHEFTPHVTIGRMDHAGGKGHVQELLAERSPSVGRFHVEAVHLTESTLEEDGPVYETVERFEL
jgi:2'-5' RNA ligase